MKNQGEHLYTMNKNVICLKCGHKGAIQSYGYWFQQDIGTNIDAPYMSHTIGFGGTIPWECMNCSNEGLIDFGGLEGYEQAFKTVKEN